ncbi:MAG: hypothetical protein HQL23_02975 [Candidatus Omnitrophica bacterium]|nr:hypothetical protein [Candidatus Omnitrophota bacterium]
MHLFAISSITVLLSSVCMVILLFAKKSHKADTQIWGCLCLTVAIWAIGSFKYSTSLDQTTAFFWCQIAYVGVILTPVMYILFVYNFVNRQGIWFISADAPGFRLQKSEGYGCGSCPKEISQDDLLITYLKTHSGAVSIEACRSIYATTEKIKAHGKKIRREYPVPDV